MARRKSTVKQSISRSPLEDLTREIDEDDHEYLEELLGYNNWDNYGCEGVADGGSLTDEDDASSFAPWGGSVCPSQRFFWRHNGSRRDIEDHDEEDMEDDRREREDELEDEMKDWYRRNAKIGVSRKGYTRPYVYGADSVRDDVGPVQVPEWFAASEELRLLKIIQEDKYRAKYRTKNDSKQFIKEIQSECTLTDSEYDKPIREIVGDSRVDIWEWDSARKSETIRKKFAEDFEKGFLCG